MGSAAIWSSAMLAAAAVGIGLRTESIADLLAYDHPEINFLELAPENWMALGGIKSQHLKNLAERFPLVAHGLSLSIGDGEPLNLNLIKSLKNFLNEYKISIYSEHLSFCRDSLGYLYDLLPVPFYEENITYLAQRIQHIQELLGRKIALENISYYHQYQGNIPEIEFINALLKQADCNMLLDINNVYVNSQNHHYDPYTFINSLPAERICYLHIAGHHRQPNNRILDTHGMPVCDEVWNLLAHTYAHIGLRPTLLERDNFVPGLDELKAELARVNFIAKQSLGLKHAS